MYELALLWEAQGRKPDWLTICQPIIFLVTSILMACLAFLCISKGYDRGDNIGISVSFLSIPFLAISVYCFFNGFLNITFP